MRASLRVEARVYEQNHAHAKRTTEPLTHLRQGFSGQVNTDGHGLPIPTPLAARAIIASAVRRTR